MDNWIKKEQRTVFDKTFNVYLAGESAWKVILKMTQQILCQTLKRIILYWEAASKHRESGDVNVQ